MKKTQVLQRQRRMLAKGLTLHLKQNVCKKDVTLGKRENSSNEEAQMWYAQPQTQNL